MKNKEKIKKGIYYLGFSVAAISKLLEISDIFEIQSQFFAGVSFFVAAVFLVKFLLDKHKLLENVLIVSLAALLAFAYTHGLPHFMVVVFLGFVSIKDVDIRKIIKIDLIIKAFFFLTHLTLFIIDMLLDKATAATAFFESSKGLSIDLYFKNPNSTGLIGIWIIVELLFLIKDKNMRHYIVSAIFATIVYLITHSRSAFFIYIAYVALHLIKNEKALHVLFKIIYPAMFILTLLIVSSDLFSGQALIDIDDMLSGRITQSMAVYNTMGVNFLPMPLPEGFLDTHVIDNFYIRCITFYGIVTAIFYYIPYLVAGKKTSREGKIVAIASAIYSFMEAVVANTGMCPTYLIMADEVINKKSGLNKKETKNG